MITYKDLSNTDVAVFLEGKRVGTIASAQTNISEGFAYYPKGKNTHGDVYRSIREVKQSLEA